MKYVYKSIEDTKIYSTSMSYPYFPCYLVKDVVIGIVLTSEELEKLYPGNVKIFMLKDLDETWYRVDRDSSDFAVIIPGVFDLQKIDWDKIEQFKKDHNLL